MLPKGTTAPTTVAEITGCTVTGAVACTPGGGVYIPARPYYLSSSLYHVSFNLRSVADLSACTSAWNNNAANTTNTSLPQACPKLAAGGETEYDVWYIAEDDNAQAGYGRSNNVQTASDIASQKLEVTTADVAPPTPASGFPKAKNVAATSVHISMNMSEPGKAWYLVVPDASAAPTAAQVVDQVSVYGGVTVVKKGSWTVPTADTDADVSLTGLDDETAYSAYVVVQDEGDADTATNKYASNSPVAETSATRVQFTTLDGSPPVFEGGPALPAVSDVDSTSFSLDVQLDEVGKAYYLVVKRTTDSEPTPPTPAQVLAGSFSGTVACGHVDVSAGETTASEIIADTVNKLTVSACQDPGDSTQLALPGEGTGGATTGSCSSCPTILPDQRYWVYVVGQDDDLNNMTSTSTIAVRTTDETPPTFKDHSSKTTPYLSGNEPSAGNPGKSNDGVTLSVTLALSEPGTAYFMVVEASKTAPTPAQIRYCGDASIGTAFGTRPPWNTYTASDSTTNTAFVCGARNVPEKDTGYEMELSGIPSETSVKVYVAAEDFEKYRPSHPALKVNPPVSNLQTAATAIGPVTTADIDPPAWPAVGGVQYPRVPFTEDTDITEDDAKISVALDEPGYVYYVVVPKDYTYNAQFTDGSARSTPTVAEVMAGTGPGGGGNVTAGTQDVAAGDTVVNITTASAALTNETAYDVYLVAEDKATVDGVDLRNKQTTVVKLTFATRDVTAPKFATGYPKVDTSRKNWRCRRSSTKRATCISS